MSKIKTKRKLHTNLQPLQRPVPVLDAPKVKKPFEFYNLFERKIGELPLTEEEYNNKIDNIWK